MARSFSWLVVAACIQMTSAGVMNDYTGYTSDYVRPKEAPLIDTHPRLRRGSTTVEQVHLQLGGNKEMVVVFVTEKAVPSVIRYGYHQKALSMTAEGTSFSYSSTLYFNSQDHDWAPLLKPPMGFPATTVEEELKLQNTYDWANESWGDLYQNRSIVKNGLGDYKNPGSYYASTVIHTVPLLGLVPGQKYFYQVEGDDEVHSFSMPHDTPMAPKTALTVGLTADLGQTAVSNGSISALNSMSPDFVLLSGDLSYADGWYPRWDSYGVLMQRLASRIPVMTVPGNHEVGDGEQFVSYRARYPMPHLASGSTDPTYWSRDIESVHVIGLNSYGATHPGSLQYEWLVRDLDTIDRSRTPWLVVMMHAPWYNSNHGHKGEATLMQKDMEKLLFDAGVDIILNGHVHAYERTHPVYDWEVNECGPMHLNLGDGGNREGAYVPWDPSQPSWSAFRESSFGVGRLDIHNGTHLKYLWRRHACWDHDFPGAMDFDFDCESDGDNSAEAMKTVDSIWITRPSSCANKHHSGSQPRPQGGFFGSGTKDSASMGWKMVALGQFILFVIVLLVLIMSKVEVHKLRDEVELLRNSEGVVHGADAGQPQATLVPMDGPVFTELKNE